jgi:hypothetical protein
LWPVNKDIHCTFQGRFVNLTAVTEDGIVTLDSPNFPGACVQADSKGSWVADFDIPELASAGTAGVKFHDDLSLLGVNDANVAYMAQATQNVANLGALPKQC